MRIQIGRTAVFSLLCAVALILTASGNSLPIAHAAREDVAYPDLLTLSDAIEAVLRAAKYEPGTTRQGSVYLHDLKSGSELEVNPGVTYSGASLTKIAVLVTFYQYLQAIEQAVPTPEQAVLLAKMMLCSDNAAANALIDMIDESPNSDVLGLGETMWRFINLPVNFNRSFQDDGSPTLFDGPVIPNNADADPNNNLLPTSVGTLIAKIQYCSKRAVDDDAGVILPGHCRRMLALMRANQIGALIEGGVPEGIPVAHKQGWIDDTHGDAALVSTPGGDYILVIILHQRKFLNYQGSFPVMAEISRLVYNAYNPTRPMKTIRSQPIPEGCVVPTAILSMLTSPDLAPLG